MLEAKRVCALTGAPGVGKSMVADMLALTHWDNDYQVVNLGSHEIDRCWDAWKSGRKQFFYFDDVFGQTDVHERVSHDSGQTLARLIRRVGATPNKRLVITTRTYVLREAELINEPISRAALRAHECIVQVTDYGTQQRARILYNHLYFSTLSRALIRKLIGDESYWQIIKHSNFTPRIIEQTILAHAVEADEQSLAQRMLGALDTPALLWGPSFRESLGELPAESCSSWLLFHLPERASRPYVHRLSATVHQSTTGGRCSSLKAAGSNLSKRQPHPKPRYRFMIQAAETSFSA